MRRVHVLAALLGVTATAAIVDRPPPLWPRGRVSGGAATPPGPAPFSQDFSYIVSSGGAVPTCNAGNSCVASCKVASDGGADGWVCYDVNGAVIGPVTQGTSTSYRTTQFGVKTMVDVTSASHPYSVMDSIRTAFNGDFTILIGGYATTLSSGVYQHLFEVNSTGQGITIRNEGGAMRTYATGLSTYNTIDAASSAQNGWALLSLRRGNGKWANGINGTEGSLVNDTSGMVTYAAGAQYEFGDRQAATLPMRGPFAFWNLYTTGDAGLIETSRREFFGAPANMASGNGTGSLCLEYDGGSSECFLTGSSMVGPLGLSTQNGANTQNLFAADNFDVSSWVDVGTPVVTASMGAGPWFVWKNQMACSLMEDDTAGALEGKRGANSYVADTLGHDSYRASFWISAGDAGADVTKARIAFNVTGGGWDDAGTSFNCDTTGLDYTVRRVDCTSPPFWPDAGSPTVKADLLVGNAAAEQGSLIVCGGKVEPRPWVDPFAPTNTSIGNSSQYVDPSAWSFSAGGGGGKVEVVFAPRWDPLNDWQSSQDVIYLFDASNSLPTHAVLMIFGYSQAGRALARIGNAGANTDIAVDGVGLTPGQFYAVSIEWRGSSTCDAVFRLDSCGSTAPGSCHATTSIGTFTAGACPDTITEAKIGTRYDNTINSSLNFYSLTTYHL